MTTDQSLVLAMQCAAHIVQYSTVHHPILYFNQATDTFTTLETVAPLQLHAATANTSLLPICLCDHDGVVRFFQIDAIPNATALLLAQADKSSRLLSFPKLSEVLKPLD